ncbi:hypothetical protein AK830_g4987 [Neonectria ditissima]|uniref:Uncharacterized protein n=1 Tax=Neonectria ditissima TaxID=78410 RepID=A0A0P7BLX9_9HYPO|nr:hypothetical protein AK830_g4987 [Neonectria ditissima]
MAAVGVPDRAGKLRTGALEQSILKLAGRPTPGQQHHLAPIAFHLSPFTSTLGESRDRKRYAGNRTTGDRYCTLLLYEVRTAVDLAQQSMEHPSGVHAPYSMLHAPCFILQDPNTAGR